MLPLEPDVWLHICWRVPPNAFSNTPPELHRWRCFVPPASEANRIGQLQIAESARAANYLMEAKGSSQAGGYRYQQATVTVSLDFLLDYFPAPSVLKVDGVIVWRRQKCYTLPISNIGGAGGGARERGEVGAYSIPSETGLFTPSACDS